MMTERDFVYWLQGFFEIANPTTMTPEQVKMVKDHLGYVFEHKQQSEAPTPSIDYKSLYGGGAISSIRGTGAIC